MRCPSCGNQVNTNVMFCKYCGEALRIRTISDSANGISMTPSRSKTHSTMLVWFGATAACAILVVVLLAFDRGHAPKRTILPALAQTAAPSLEPVSLPFITPIPIPSALPSPELAFFSKDAIVAGNSSNAGLFASNDESIYFRTGIFQESSNSTYGLYRQTLEGGDVSLVYGGPNWCTSADDRYVYFYDHKDGNRLKRLDPDSGSLEYLTDFSVDNVVLLGEYLYANSKNGMYLVDPRRAVPKRLTSFQVRSISMWENSLYFLREKDGAMFMLRSGGQPVAVSGIYAKQAVAANGKLYYTALSGRQGGRLYESGLSGEAAYPLISDNVSAFTLCGQSIYYINRNRGSRIYSYNIIINQTMQIDDHRAMNLCAVGDWLYYVNADADTTNENDTFALWRVRNDGTQSQPVQW